MLYSNELIELLFDQTWEWENFPIIFVRLTSNFHSQCRIFYIIMTPLISALLLLSDGKHIWTQRWHCLSYVLIITSVESFEVHIVNKVNMHNISRINQIFRLFILISFFLTPSIKWRWLSSSFHCIFIL